MHLSDSRRGPVAPWRWPTTLKPDACWRSTGSARSITRRRIAVASLGLAVVAIGCGKKKADHNRSRDVAENLAIFRELPVFPGARVLKTTSAPYYREERGPPIGHTTNVVNGVPAATLDNEVIGFYAENLRPRWTCRREEIGILDLGPASRRPSSGRGRVLVLTCTSGSALVSVNADGMEATPPSFELAVDHRGAVHLGRDE